jgi:hypothetical protein
MPEYSDIYVISDKRDRKTIENFLHNFLPKREEIADEYEVPQFSDNPEIIFEKAVELIAYCENNKNIEHAIYWRATENSKPEHGMVFYLSDGFVIYGLSTDAANQEYASELLNELKEYFGTTHGYIGHEASPDVENYSEFLQQEVAHQS